MTEIKHTPGPWTQDRDWRGEGTGIILAPPLDENEGGATIICRLGLMSEANAQLISAAPELLSALETIVEHLAESHATEKDADHYGDNPEECSYCKSIAAARAAIDKATKGNSPR